MERIRPVRRVVRVPVLIGAGTIDLDACERCGVPFDPRLDHLGRPHSGGTPRRFCSEDCRTAGHVSRRTRAQRVARLHRAVAERRAAEEAGGLLTIPGLLPEVVEPDVDALAAAIVDAA